MPNRADISYFGAGPARLPTSVLNKAASALLNHDNSGLGLAEQSHRSALSERIISSAASSFKSLLHAPADYTVLFMQGGGTGQFSSVVYNLLGYWVERRLRRYGGDLEKVKKDLAVAKCEYILTGGWSLKASQEAARLLGDEHVSIVADARTQNDGKWGTITGEKEWKLVEKKNSVLTYYCDNETVDGVEFPGFPDALGGKEDEEDERLVVGDMSSNILSRPVDVKRFAVIFAGAQKNVGTPGVTIILVRNSILECQPKPATLRALGLPVPPIMMDYPTTAAANSLYNTLPIFDVYIASEVMALLLSTGGIPSQAASAARKAGALYTLIDKYKDIYIPVVKDPKNRSRMNVCFRLGKSKAGQDLEKTFFQGAEQRGLTGVKGHRSVGGARVSCYNAITEEEVKKLVTYMKEFADSQSHTYLALN